MLSRNYAKIRCKKGNSVEQPCCIYPPIWYIMLGNFFKDEEKTRNDRSDYTKITMDWTCEETSLALKKMGSRRKCRGKTEREYRILGHVQEKKA